MMNFFSLLAKRFWEVESCALKLNGVEVTVLKAELLMNLSRKLDSNAQEEIGALPSLLSYGRYHN